MKLTKDRTRIMYKIILKFLSKVIKVVFQQNFDCSKNSGNKHAKSKYKTYESLNIKLRIIDLYLKFVKHNQRYLAFSSTKTSRIIRNQFRFCPNSILFFTNSNKIKL